MFVLVKNLVTKVKDSKKTQNLSSSHSQLVAARLYSASAEVFS